MGRAMPSSVARTSSDLLTKLLARIIDELDYIREVARRKTWRPRSPRRIPDPTRSTPQRLGSAGCMPPDRRVRTTGWLRYEGHGSKASAKPTRDKGIGMRKAHRHHLTDGMARAVGTSGSSASIWARTHRSGRGLRRGSRFG